MKIRIAFLLSVFLTACADRSAIRHGQNLLAEGRIEEGLAEIQRASNEAPDNREYRKTYFRQREFYVAQLLSHADMVRQQGNLDEAEAEYLRVQGMERNNDRAKAGLAAILTERRHRERLKDAESLLKAGKPDAAEIIVRGILAENANQRGARALSRRLAEQTISAGDISPALKSSLSRPVTLQLSEASIRSVFDFLSKTAGVNFVFDKEVKADARTTLFVRNSPIEDVIRLVLVTNQLDFKALNDNTLLIYPNSQNKTKDYKDLMVKGFYLANADVKQVANTIKTLVKTKDVVIDEKLNYLAMRDTPEAIRMAERLIANQDMPDPEVVLELEVLEVSANRLEELGIRYPERIGYSVVGEDKVAGTLRLPEWHNRNSGLVRMSITNPAFIINLKKTDSETNLLANPRIRVKNKDKAKVHIGERVPVITTTSTANVGVSEAVNYLDVGLKLEVEPTISLDDEVSIKVGLEVSNILETVTRASGLQTYRLGTRNTTTSLRLRDSETQVLAGLIQDDDRKTAHKVPGLGDLPLIGRLFSNHDNSGTKTEIVLLITPRIVRNLNLSDSSGTAFFTGTEAVIGAQPIRLNAVEGGEKSSTKIDGNPSAVSPATPALQPATPLQTPPSASGPKTELLLPSAFTQPSAAPKR